MYCQLHYIGNPKCVRLKILMPFEPKHDIFNVLVSFGQNKAGQFDAT